MTAYHRILLIIGSALFGLWILLAIFAPWIAPFDPIQPLIPFAKPGAVLPIGATTWLGTDLLGRDILSRIIWAARVDLTLVGGTIALTYIIGLPIARAAARRNGVVATAARGLSAVGRAVPVVISYFVLGYTFAFGPFAFVVAFVFASLPNLIDFLSLLSRALKSNGFDRPTKNQITAYVVTDALKRLVFWLAIAGCIAFVGFGPIVPPTATFGGILGENFAMTLAFPHMVVGPIAVLFVLLLGASLLASGLEALLPISLKTADPAKPSYRPGEIFDEQELD